MAIKFILMIGLLCGTGAIAGSLAWKSKVDIDGRRWELEERAAQLRLENVRLAQQIAAQRRSMARLRSECSSFSAQVPSERLQRQAEPDNALAVGTDESMAELRQVGNRVEVAPGGPMSPISD